MNPLIAQMIKRSGRSWWQVRYIDGRVLSEWDTLQGEMRLPLGVGRSSRWEEITKYGMVGIRLLCPNGMAGEIEGILGTQFFQLKAGGISVGIGAGGDIKGVTRFCDAHIIGAVEDDNGNCWCRVWEHKEKRLLAGFHDNIHDMKYRNIGKLNLDVQGIKV